MLEDSLSSFFTDRPAVSFTAVDLLTLVSVDLTFTLLSVGPK